ncbi:MAG TPA: peptidylprolyl isomerase [Chryseolinea sp.]|nr:peptidylprolyl isomerase [Chryseolinea sp.]HPH46963.1 peptidylprolyl isomerase [Chryseolinea sp.]HPM29859.1 peptidylprolyl isomerase [Chryseolinea sp.]
MLKYFMLLFCSIIVTSGIAQKKKSKSAESKSPVVFTVDATATYADEFFYLYKKNHQNKQVDFTKEKIEEYLNLFINFKLKVTEARKRGMDTTKAFVKEYASYKEELRKPYLPDTKLTDSLVKLTYSRLQEEIKASHILINVKPDASPEDTLSAYSKIITIRNRSIADEDFGTLASSLSEDPSAKSNQGSLGYFTAMQMVYPFENMAYATKVGEVSLPVRTRFGYHIIKVMDRKPSRGEVEVSHIMIRTGEGKDNEKAKNLIFTVYEQSQGGRSWEELCKQYSEDPSTKDTGGRLKPFGVGGMISVPEFERVAFSLRNAGEISDPFQTQYGWHIIRLERKIPLPTLEEMSTSLKNRVNRDERTQLSKQALQIKLRKRYQWKENPVIKAKVFALGDTSLVKGKWQMPNYSEKEILFTLKGKSFYTRNFLAYVQKNQKATNQQPEKYMEQLYNNFADASIMQMEEEKIMRENPEYSFLLKEYYEGILLFEIMEKEVWNKASDDSTGQVTYFNSHLANYQAGERIHASIYSSKETGFENPLKALLEAGDEKKIQEFISVNKIKVESGFYKPDEKPVLQKVTSAKGIYSAENNGMYYLARLIEILPAGNMSFEEARSGVISDYQSFLEQNWINQLKKKYEVKVNEKGKQHVLDQLLQP